jgi:hypothetical protein
MSSDDQYTALGHSGAPTNAGFFIDANNTTYGVNVRGIDLTRQGCGVYAEAMLQSPGFRSAQDGSRPGVWGVGDHYGVYGIGYKLYADQVDNTPRVSSDAELGFEPDDARATGAIGVVGASLNVAGVLGVADLVNDLSKVSPGSHFVEAATLVQEIAAHPAGVIGISGSNAGVIGVNVSGTGVVASISQQLSVQLAAGSSDSVSNTGVLGWSAVGRGGVFGSAQPVMDGVHPPENDRGSAQIRLLPLPVSLFRTEIGQAEVGPTPSLPRAGLAGDLIAVVIQAPPGTLQPQTTHLWFCIASGTRAEAATWAQVQLGNTIAGHY